MRPRPSRVSAAVTASRWSGCTLIRKRLGASGGKVRCQPWIRSVRVMARRSSAIRPTASAHTWVMVAARRRTTPASAKRSAGRPAASPRTRARPRMHSQATSANTAKAPRKPPATTAPSLASPANHQISRRSRWRPGRGLQRRWRAQRVRVAPQHRAGGTCRNWPARARRSPATARGPSAACRAGWPRAPARGVDERPQQYHQHLMHRIAQQAAGRR